MSSRAHRQLSEQTIQREVFRHLRTRAAPGVFAIKHSKPYALELKAEGGKLSLAQEACLIRLRESGVTATHAHGLDQAIRVLEMWGLLSGRSQ